jgi:hypothetical protein
MRELDKELKELRLYGMAGAWEDLVKQGGHATLESSRWLLEHLLQAEVTDRAMRSVSYQMHTAKFPCTATWRASTSNARRWTES